LATLIFAGIAWFLFEPSLTKKKNPVTVQTPDLRAKYEELMVARSLAMNTNFELVIRGGVEWPGLAITKAAKAKWLEHFASSVKSYRSPDPDAYYILKPNRKLRRHFAEHPKPDWVRHTNSLGMRGTLEPAEDAPDLRVIVVGDSHIEGVCRDHETYPAVLGRLLQAEYPEQTIESFNAGVGGYDAYNYLGVLEKHVGLKPDVFVMTVYGGNDFKGGMVLRDYYTGQAGPRTPVQLKKRIAKSGVELHGFNPQEIEQAAYFMSFPAQRRRAVEMMVAITDRMQSICSENGIELICVYLPPPMRGQPQYYQNEIEKLATALPEFADPLGSSDEVADGWLEFVAERDIELLDLRPIFAAADEPLYWTTDCHVNLVGQQLIAESIRPRIEAVLVDKQRDGADGQMPGSAPESGD
jgi:hypothetical protein